MSKVAMIVAVKNIGRPSPDNLTPFLITGCRTQIIRPLEEGLDTVY
jgi:hypothetical protein